MSAFDEPSRFPDRRLLFILSRLIEVRRGALRQWSAVVVLLLLLGWAGTTFPQTSLTNTPVTEAQINPLIPDAVPVKNVIAFGVIDNASPIGGGDCEGHVQSAAYDIGGGLFLYVYQLECHCSPNWDVGYAAAGGGLKVPLNGNLPLSVDFNNDGVAAETSFHTTNEGFKPFSADLVAMNEGDDFSNSSVDFTISAISTPTHIEFSNTDGIFLTGDVVGFVTNASPTIVNGAHLGGSNTSFDLVAPSPCATDPGFQSTRFPVPGPDGGELRYKANISRTGGSTGDALSVAITVCNPNPRVVKGVVCSMANTTEPDTRHDNWEIDRVSIPPVGGVLTWKCTRAGNVNSPPSFHFGCRQFNLNPGEKQHFFDDTGVLTPTRLAPYIDFLHDAPVDPSCSVNEPDGVKGPKQFLDPVASPGTYVNIWSIYKRFETLSPTLGCTMDWSTGNWFTMANPDTYLARLNGTVRDAPTGSVLTFRFPPGSPALERTFIVPPANPGNQTCSGLPVRISEPFAIPPDPATMSLDIEVPAECSTLPEGSVVRFEAEAVGDIGSPVFQPGEFIVEHSGTCVVDNTPPQIAQFTVTPRQDGSLDVRVAATDEISTPIEALLRFQVDGGPEEQISMNFDDPPVVGDTVFFRKIIGPFPVGSSSEISAEVLDDVANPRTSSTTIVVPLDIMPGRFPNLFDLSDGGIPVVILTTDTFDASTVDPKTVRFGATGTEAAPIQLRLGDVDRDGDIDRGFSFRPQDTGIACGDTSAVLTGKTFSGEAILGSDSIQTVGCK